MEYVLRKYTVDDTTRGFMTMTLLACLQTDMAKYKRKHWCAQALMKYIIRKYTVDDKTRDFITSTILAYNIWYLSSFYENGIPRELKLKNQLRQSYDFNGNLKSYKFSLLDYC